MGRQLKEQGSQNTCPYAQRETIWSRTKPEGENQGIPLFAYLKYADKGFLLPQKAACQSILLDWASRKKRHANLSF